MTSGNIGANTTVPTPGDTGDPWFCPRPTIKILFYTDDPRISLDPDVNSDDNEFGLRILYDLLAGHTNGLADIDISLLDRHASPSEPIRLTAETLDTFDEVWFFTARWEPNLAIP